MSKAIWGGLVTGCFGLFIAALTAPSDVAWKTPLLVFTGFGCVVCAIGWLRCHQDEYRVESARGDLLLTVRHFDYDESDGQLCATLAFYNNDSISRNVLGVSFLHRPTADHTGYHRWETGPHDALWIGHLDEIKLPPQAEETKRYRSVAPAKITPEIINRPGAQSGLYVSFTNARRQTDHAVVIAMENPPLQKLLLPGPLLRAVGQ
jgi:hypothetical protein